MHPQQAYQMCAENMYRYVGVRMQDGSVHDGFIAEVHSDHVVLAIPTCDMMEELQDQAPAGVDYRQFGFGFGVPAFGFPRRRFFRRRLPFRFFREFFFLPFFFI